MKSDLFISFRLLLVNILYSVKIKRKIKQIQAIFKSIFSMRIKWIFLFCLKNIFSEIIVNSKEIPVIIIVTFEFGSLITSEEKNINMKTKEIINNGIRMILFTSLPLQFLINLIIS